LQLRERYILDYCSCMTKVATAWHCILYLSCCLCCDIATVRRTYLSVQPALTQPVQAQSAQRLGHLRVDCKHNVP
jgi:hypothetical protein